MVEYISIILFALAAVCNSIYEKLLFHYGKSTFSNKQFEPIWWNPKISYRNKYKRTPRIKANLKYKFPFSWMIFTTDAFHFFKSLMIVFIALSIILYKPICSWDTWLNIDLSLFNIRFGNIINLLSDLLIYGFAWNLFFNSFFNIIWEKGTA